MNRWKTKLFWAKLRVRAVILAVIAVFAAASAADAQSICNAGDQVVNGRVDITQSCTITGSLTIQSGMVNVNYTATPTAVFKVAGNITVSGFAALWIEGGKFEIQQDYSQHRKMSSTNDATIVLKSTTVVLNQGPGLKYLFYDAFDRSKMFAVDSTLDRTTSWLIANQFGDSRLLGIRTRSVPTEVYVKGNSTVTIADPTSTTGVWLDFGNGATGTVDLPAQTGADGHLQAYSWRIGRGTSGLTGVGWQLEIANASVGLGLESHTGSRITVNGRGAPATGEVKIAYHADSGTQSLSGLGGGLQNKTLGGTQLTLQNVDLGLIAWQLYAHDNATLSVTSSIVNEIGVASGGRLTIRDSIIQFGAVSSLGSNAAQIDIHNSQIYSQTIEALRDGVVNIHDSAVFGSVVVAHEGASAVNFHRGALLTNSVAACPLVISQMMNIWGVPICNPFLAPGASVTKAGAGQVSCDSTFACSW